MVLSSKVLTVSLLFSVVLIFYINTPVENISNSAQKKNQNNNNYGVIKEVVAYSLLKDIEIKHKEFKCDKLEFGNKTIIVKSGRKQFLKNDNEEEFGDLWSRVDETDLFVYSVYMDTRLEPYNYVRVLGMIEGKWIETFYCQIFTNDGNYHITKAEIRNLWSENWNTNDSTTYFNPILASCLIPLGRQVKSVSLSKASCRLGYLNYLLKPQEAKEKLKFTLCIKPLNFVQDVSEKLFHWLEMNALLGADRFHIYVGEINQQVQRFLNWYQSKSGVEIRLYKHVNIRSRSSSEDNRRLNSHPKIIKEENNNQRTRIAGLEASIWQKRRYEILVYNDCFYRNLYSTEYVLPIDVDEIIVPRGVHKWSELLNKTLTSQLQEEYASFTVQNAYYLHRFTGKQLAQKPQNKLYKKRLPFFFRYIVRSEFSAKEESGKSFVSTKNALTVFNHYALEVLRPGVKKNYFLSSEDVQMNHYKETCSVFVLPECDKYVSSPVRIVDPVILKYQDEFYHRLKKFYGIY